MEGLINWNKDFVGKAATLKAREAGAKRKLVVLTVDAPMDVSSDEAVMAGAEAVGYTISDGYAHRVGKSMAMAYVGTAHATPGTRRKVEILGALCDPSGQRMRG